MRARHVSAASRTCSSVGREANFRVLIKVFDQREGPFIDLFHRIKQGVIRLAAIAQIAVIFVLFPSRSSHESRAQVSTRWCLHLIPYCLRSRAFQE
jgi:hypothetical protein